MPTTTHPLSAGDYKLANGHLVLKIEADPVRPREFTVLAFTGHEHFEPFVTWRAGLNHADPLSDEGVLVCYWGHYFQSLDAALEDFEERC